MTQQKYQKALSLLPYSASASSFFLYIGDSASTRQKLAQQIRNCRLDERKCRFNVWRMLMGVCSVSVGLAEKLVEIGGVREGYRVKKLEACSGVVPVKKDAPIVRNPLMKAMVKTPKLEEVDDEFLKDEIRKDVQRTYQQQQFFQQEPIIKLLSAVLFVWCKCNPDVSYKQGMNQVLASIVYVYFQEVYTTDRLPEGFAQLLEQQKQDYITFNSIEFAQPDIFSVFDKIMSIQNQMYKTETDSNLKGVINPNSKNNTPILQRIITIIDQKLKALDIQLFRTIKLQDVQTKTFLLRWIRCMHTREFSLENSFFVWDSIFLEYCEYPASREKNQFQFIDAMCVAMFVYLRSIALTRETAYEILQIYQKYPNLKKGGYLEELIGIAWSLCEALRQPAALNSADWVGQQSSKVDSKIQVFKSKDGLMKQAKEEEAAQKVKEAKEREAKEAKQAREKEAKEAKEREAKQAAAKLKQQQNKQAKASKQPQPQQPKAPEQPKNGIQAPSEPHSQPTEPHPKDQTLPHPDLNFPIVLAASEWQQLVQKLQKSLALNSDEESRKYIMEGMEILKSKVESS